MRRRGALLLILPVLVAGIFTGSGLAAAQELKFGFTPVLTESEMRAEFQPLMTYLYPRAMLIEKGVAPEKYFKETIFAGGHDKVIAAVLEGKVDAGAIYDGALGVAKAKGMRTEDLISLVSTDPIPHDAIAVRIAMDEALAKKIQTALVNLDKSEVGRKVIANSKKKLTGHVIAEDSLFDVVRRTAKIAGM